MNTVTIHDHPDELADAAAAMIAAHLADTEGEATLGLSGGSTPPATYRRLAGAAVDWERVTVWIADERWVPPDHPDSNTGMVRGTLGPGAARIVAPDTTLDDPSEAAAAYDRRLGEIFAGDPSGRPGLVLLGVGDDGHTGSLFPGTAALGETERRYVANWVEDKDSWRVTGTFPLFWAARKVVFLVQGADKAVIMNRILEDRVPFPARRVAEGAADVTWLLDAAAASQLSPPP